MKQSTKRRKAASRHIPEAIGQEAFSERLLKVVSEGKAAFDSLSFELGRILAESIMYIDREEVSGLLFSKVLIDDLGSRLNDSKSLDYRKSFEIYLSERSEEHLEKEVNDLVQKNKKISHAEMRTENIESLKQFACMFSIQNFDAWKQIFHKRNAEAKALVN